MTEGGVVGKPDAVCSMSGSVILGSIVNQIREFAPSKRTFMVRGCTCGTGLECRVALRDPRLLVRFETVRRMRAHGSYSTRVKAASGRHS